MRKIFTILCAFACFCALKAQNIPEVLYYKFDGTGTSVPNLASNPPAGTATATILGAVTQGSSNLCNGSLIGSGSASSTDYMNTNWAPNLGTGSWTISFRTSNIGPSSTLFYIWGDANTASLRCFTNGVAGANNWILRGGGLTDVLINGGAVVAPTMNTYVYDQPLNQVRAYLNGVLVNTVGQTAPNLTGTGPFKVCGYSTNVGLPAAGNMDEYRVYNRALSAAEIMELYNPYATSGFLGPDASLCPGDSVELQLNWPAGDVMWSNGSTDDSTWVDSSATYTVDITGNCGVGSDTIQVLVAPVPTAGFLGADATICTGDTVLLTVAGNVIPGDSVFWSTGDSLVDSIWVGTPGIYTATIVGFCDTYMDTVVIAASAIQYSGFLLAASSSACAGDSIMLWSTMSFDTYAWSTGSGDTAIYVTTSGDYILTGFDACGSGSDTVSVTFTPAPTAGFTFTTNLLTASFTNSASGSNLSYSWNFGDTQTSTASNPTHTYAADGSYIVTLTVTGDCGTATFTDTVVVQGIGISDGLGFDVSVYPNPANTQVSITADIPGTQEMTISLVSITGQVMRQDNLGALSGQLKHTLDLKDVAAGIYFVRIHSNDGAAVLRLDVVK